MAVAKAYTPPSRTWESDAFKSAVASDVTNHMAADELAGWSGVYANMPYFGQATDKEQDLIHQLADGVASPRRLSDADADRMTRAVQGLRRTNADLDLWSRVVLAGSAPLHAVPRAAARAAIIADARSVYGGCVVVPELKLPPSSGSQYERARRDS